MQIHSLQHVPFEGVGSIESWAKAHHAPITVTRLDRAETLPAVSQLDWLIVMGGPMSVSDEAQYPWLTQEKHFIEQAIAAQKIVIGICLGAQLIANVLGARVFPNRHKEIGWFPIRRTPAGLGSPIFRGLPDEFDVFHWHGETFDLPSEAVLIASSEACQHQAFTYHDHVIGLQFHLETTPQSARDLIANCGAELIDAPYIQRADTMLQDEQKFRRINQLMETLLQHVHTRPATDSVASAGRQAEPN